MKSGLEDVVAAETVLSDVDGTNGRLIMRGVSLDDLARSTFEDVAALLLEGFLTLPDDLQAALGTARQDVFATIASAGDLTVLPPVDALRALLARLGDGQEAQTALRLLAAPGVFTPAILRQRQGLAPIAPDTGLSQAGDALRMLHGKAPTAEQEAALNRYLVTVADHGLNASTFAARVVASTQAGLASSVLAALSALKGPLHGGAPGPVLDMLDAVGTPDRAQQWINDTLDSGERLMGFGHRVYRVRDPRADALKSAVALLTRAGAIDPARLALAEAIETAALAELRARKPDRVLETNVEFYTALLLEALGFPREAFTCIFAMGRVTGWIAHAREQAETGRLIRPMSIYVGPKVRDAA
ncbi:MAG: citrate synthase/methylcitrate synthase [Candidatus Devosia phytovorans]|uniref:Citrate synthase n=1 Tax=Candidatus Devosia phytovorans TaxID=3121372 RepID=A0AAJ5VWR0_9HYPH|nr:citrate synthase/methylcitrate synthase [Devosia sp.]WEK06149.1 MAG: citrate synthase/methylcitrate synthase [Devosia sp.]